MADRFPFRQYDVAHRVLVVQRLREQLTIGHLLTLRAEESLAGLDTTFQSMPS